MNIDIDWQIVIYIGVAAVCWIYLCYLSTRKPKAVRLKSQYFKR